MSYKTYCEYVPSESKWFDKIPKDWDIRPIKHLAKTIPGGTPSTSNLDYWENGNIPWLPSGIVQNCIINEEDAFKFITEKGLLNSATKYIGPNSILVALTGATCANIGFLTFKATANQSVISVEPYATFPKYIYYALLSQREQILDKKTGGAQSGINDEDVKHILIPTMSFEEQQQIANYLDQQTAKIDATITKNKELIDLLEEKRVSLINHVVTKGLNLDVPIKDSGIEWIGEIPEHWEVEKLKNISQIQPSNVDKKSKDNEPPVLLCNYTDVYNNEFITMNLDFMKATATYDQIRKLSLNVGDIIITKDSESADDIAVPAIVTEELENVVCGYHLAVIKPNTNIINPKFLFRSFQSDRINKQFELGANGVTRFGLGSYPINNAYVCQPPLNEQKEIANYLDIETAKIFKATDKILKHIELLEEYKTSLIHHVVTGKVDVRGEEI